MDRRLALYAIVPLGLTFLLLSVLAWPIEPQELALGVAVEIVGIIVTVLYVDWVIHSREKAKWADTDALIQHEIGKASFQTLSTFAHLMGLYELIFPRGDETDVLLGEIPEFVIRKAASLESKSISPPLVEFDKQQITELVQGLVAEYESWSAVIDLHTRRLDPPQVQGVLRIRTLLEDIARSIRSSVIMTEVTTEALPDMVPDSYSLLSESGADDVGQFAVELFGTIERINQDQ